MARTFIASDPESGRSAFLIEVRPDLREASPAELDRFKLALYDERIHSGLLIALEQAYFVRDRLTTLGFDAASFEVEPLATPILFERTHGGEVEFGNALYGQVKEWLEQVSASWWNSIPDEALPLMLPEMVGRVTGADFEEADWIFGSEGHP